jgi:hypothetical protein
LIEIDQFWAELFDAFYNNGKKHVDDQYILGLKVWHRTPIAKLQHQTASDLMVCHMLREKTQRLLTIFDCGTGDGIMVLRFLKAMHVPDTSAIKVVLIDQSKACLRASAFVLRTQFPHMKNSISKSRIEDVDVDSLVDPNRFSLAIFSSVLHELPLASRVDLIKRWIKRVDMICISEIEGNHDRPAPRTVEYCRSVWRFYRRAFDEVMTRRGLTKSEKLLCIRSVIMPEVIRIIRNDAASPVDRHFRLRDVRAALRKVGSSIEWRSSLSLSGLKAFAVLISR